MEKMAFFFTTSTQILESIYAQGLSILGMSKVKKCEGYQIPYQEC